MQKSSITFISYIDHVIAPVFVISLFLTLAFSNNASGYERKVLFEDFTSSTCPPCASAAAAVEAGLVQVGDDLVAPVTYHVWWPGPGNDPWWLDNNDHNRTRVEYYGINGAPTYLIDGTRYGGQRTANAFAAAIRRAAEEDSPLEISMMCSIDDDNVLHVRTEVTAEADINNSRIYVSLNEDEYRYRGTTDQEVFYDSMVRMLPNGSGRSFSIDEGETLVFEEELDLEGVGWHVLERDNLIVVSWVQANNQEVHQSQNFFFAPGVMMDQWEVTDEADGDGDGRAEAGETVGIVVTLENNPDRLAVENLTLQVSCDDEGINFDNDAIEIEIIEPGEEFNNMANPFNFVVAEDFVAHPVTFNLHLTSEDEMIDIEREFEIMIEWPEFLLVDATNNRSAGAAMKDYFGRDLPYADTFNRAEEGIIFQEVIDNYDIVIWHSFNNFDEIVGDFEEEILMEYLDNGGTLIMSSAGFVRDQSNSRLMRTYFKAELDDSDTEENRISGIAVDPHFVKEDDRNFYAGGNGNEDNGAGYPIYSPSILPIDGSWAVLEWTRPHDVCGVANVNDTYKTLLLTFPIESLEGFFGTHSRDEFLTRVLDWHTNPVSVPVGSDEGVPYQFNFSAAYPNPFNSSTTISFTLDAAGEVSLGLFDMTGRNIAQVLNRSMKSGNHQINVDAEELGLASGVYYLELSAGVNSARQKIAYIR